MSFQTLKVAAMPSVTHVRGKYTIPALATETFTFWNPTMTGVGELAYFNVGIQPEPDRERFAREGITEFQIVPLIEVRREYGYYWKYLDVVSAEVRIYIYVTLQNPNDYDVTFIANHVQIYEP